MFCSNCEIKLHDGARFCHNCGAPVSVQAADMRSQAPKPEPANDGFSHSMTTLRGGFIEWAVSYDDEQGHHRREYTLMDTEIMCFGGDIALGDSWETKEFHAGVETAKMIDEMVNDLFLTVGRSNLNNDTDTHFGEPSMPDGVDYQWSFKFKKIKELRALRNESMIYLKAGSKDDEYIRVHPQDFDAIWSRLISVCPNAMIFQG